MLLIIECINSRRQFIILLTSKDSYLKYLKSFGYNQFQLYSFKKQIHTFNVSQAVKTKGATDEFTEE